MRTPTVLALFLLLSLKNCSEGDLGWLVIGDYGYEGLPG